MVVSQNVAEHETCVGISKSGSVAAVDGHIVAEPAVVVLPAIVEEIFPRLATFSKHILFYQDVRGGAFAALRTLDGHSAVVAAGHDVPADKTVLYIRSIDIKFNAVAEAGKFPNA